MKRSLVFVVFAAIMATLVYGLVTASDGDDPEPSGSPTIGATAVETPTPSLICPTETVWNGQTYAYSTWCLPTTAPTDTQEPLTDPPTPVPTEAPTAPPETAVQPTTVPPAGGPPEAPVMPVEPSGSDLEERLALRQMVCDAFWFDSYMCNQVVWAESIGNWNPNWRCHVYGPCWSPTDDCGLMQTNIIHAWRYEALGYSIYDGCFIPAVNIQVALAVYEAQGPGAWTTY